MSQGTVAIVAGAGGALGHATVAALAASGLTVVALDRSEQAMKDLGDAVRHETADPGDPGAVKQVVDRIAAEVGPPGVLVNTVGAFRVADAVDTTPEMLRLMLDVNLGPALWLSQAVAPHMRAQARAPAARDPGQRGSPAADRHARQPGRAPGRRASARGVPRGCRRSDRLPGQRRSGAGERRDPAGLRRLAARPGAAGRIRITSIRR